MDDQVRIIHPPRARAEPPRGRVEPHINRSVRPPPTRHRGRYLGLLAVAVLIALILWHPWSRSTPPTARTRDFAQPVREATAITGNMPVVMQGIGTVTPLDTVTVMTQINGQLMDVGFKEGQIIKKGDFLAQIDPRPYQVALAQAQGTLAHDQGLLDQAKADFARYQTLLRQDSISRQQAEDQKYLIAQYTGSVQTDQANINNAKLNLIYCHITAPVTGRIGLRQVDPGNFVQTTNTNGIVVLTQLQPISVIFPLPQDDLEQVMSRLQHGARLPVTAYDHTNVKVLASGYLETVDNEIDPTTGTAKLRAVFPNTDNVLFPNEFVNAHLVVNTLDSVVLVPTAAVQTGAPGTYVWLVKPDNTVAVQKVTLGPSNAEQIAILSGLVAGDRVVIDGTDRLKEGAKVEVPSVTPAAAAAPQGQVPGRHHHRQSRQ